MRALFKKASISPGLDTVDHVPAEAAPISLSNAPFRAVLAFPVWAGANAVAAARHEARIADFIMVTSRVSLSRRVRSPRGLT